jgi:hypothetical protein
LERFADVSVAEPGDHAFVAHTYDATWLALIAAAWSLVESGSLEPAGLARGLRRVSEGAAVDVGAAGLSAIESAFLRREGVDVRGASGPLDFDPETEELRAEAADVEMWRYSGGLDGLEPAPPPGE